MAVNPQDVSFFFACIVFYRHSPDWTPKPAPTEFTILITQNNACLVVG